MTDEMPAQSPVRQLHVLHDSKLDVDRLQADAADTSFLATPWADRDAIEAGARVLLFLGDEQIRDLAPLALEKQWEVGLLPHPEAHRASTALGVKGSLAELLAFYQESAVVEVDALVCNDELVFSSVVIGQVLALRPYDINRPQTNWSLFKGALKGLSLIHI